MNDEEHNAPLFRKYYNPYNEKNFNYKEIKL